MNRNYLQVTYRNGRPFAAYLYLPRKLGDKSVKTVKCEGGLLLDYAEDGRPIGLEIVSPSTTSVEAINRALASANVESIGEQDLRPLLSAA